MKTLSILLFSILLTTQSLAQKAPKIKYGKVSPEELSMTTHPLDPQADAVILYDKGEVTFKYQDKIGWVKYYNRHTRIKIFKKEAYDLANVQFLHYQSDKVQDFDGVAHNLEDGKVVSTKLNKENIFTEKITKNLLEYKAVLPGVREGTVLEYRYELVDETNAHLRDWQFQHNHYPTVWSEFEAEVPAFIQFNKLSTGWIPYDISKAEKEDKSIMLNWTERSDGRVSQSTSHTVKVEYDAVKMHFAQKDVPALKAEAFVAAPSDYLSQISFNISAIYQTDIQSFGTTYRLANTFARPILSTWENLGKDMLEDVYEKHMNATKATEEASQSATAGKTLPSDKVAALYEYVGKNYQEQGGYSRVFPRQSIEKTVKAQNGTPVEVNLVLINMLKKAGIEAWPVLISTRKFGKILSFKVSLDAFNYMLVAVMLDDKIVLLDAASWPNPVGLLDGNLLNGLGLSLRNPEQVEWIELKNTVTNRTAVLGTFQLAADGRISGKVTVSETGFPAMINLRRADNAEESIRRGFNTWTSDGEISGLTRDASGSSLKHEFSVDMAGQATASGNKIYLNPLLGLGETENPFNNPDRKFGVDFDALSEVTYNFSIQLPAGYTVEDAPKPAKLLMGDKLLVYEYILDNTTPDVLKVVLKFRLKQLFLGSEEYTNLRQFYTLMTEKNAEQVVLVKK